MPCTINLRHDQSSRLISSSQSDNVVIFAASWVQTALAELGKVLQRISFQVLDHVDRFSRVLDTFTLTEEISLQQLQMITRLLPTTVTGRPRPRQPRGIDNYEPDLADRSVIYALKDLVRQCVMIGLDRTTHYGGYGGHARVKQKKPVLICDLIGLEFSHVYHSGRFVLIPQSVDPDVFPVGFLDKIIYENVVGEVKPSFEGATEAISTGSSRFEAAPTFYGNPVYFDSLAYKRFVKQDVVVTGLGLHAMAVESGYEHVHFKFLKYGVGYFAGWYWQLLDKHILAGVVDGLEVLFQKLHESSTPTQRVIIMEVELPYFSADSETAKRLEMFREKYGIAYSFNREDALLEPESVVRARKKKVKAIFATTNCADPHAATGNEMGFGSVDAAIAENLETKANIFCPCLNKRIRARYLEL